MYHTIIRRGQEEEQEIPVACVITDVMTITSKQVYQKPRWGIKFSFSMIENNFLKDVFHL